MIFDDKEPRKGTEIGRWRRVKTLLLHSSPESSKCPPPHKCLLQKRKENNCAALFFPFLLISSIVGSGVVRWHKGEKMKKKGRGARGTCTTKHQNKRVKGGKKKIKLTTLDQLKMNLVRSWCACGCLWMRTQASKKKKVLMKTDAKKKKWIVSILWLLFFYLYFTMFMDTIRKNFRYQDRTYVEKRIIIRYEEKRKRREVEKAMIAA